MKLLIDSHVLVWSATKPTELSTRVRDLLADAANEIWVSAVTAYELEFKRARDPLIAQLPADLDEAVTGQRFGWLPVNHAHAIAAGRLPRLHGDPFDRIIIAQAFAENASVISRDRWFDAYGLSLIW